MKMSVANIEPANKGKAHLEILRITFKNEWKAATQWKFMVLPLQINVYYFGFQRSLSSLSLALLSGERLKWQAITKTTMLMVMNYLD